MGDRHAITLKRDRSSEYTNSDRYRESKKRAYERSPKTTQLECDRSSQYTNSDRYRESKKRAYERSPKTTQLECDRSSEYTNSDRDIPHTVFFHTEAVRPTD
jgi:hypothetical protein